MTPYERIREILIVEMGVEAEAVTPETALAALNIDSLETASLVLALEEAFGIDVPEDDFQKLRTVRDIAEYAEKRMAALA